MAGLEDLAQYLLMNQATKQAIAADDPYREFQAVPDALSSIILQAEPGRYSTRDRVVGGLATGLLSGLFGGLSKDYQGRAEDAYTQAIANAATGQGGERPRVLSPSLFGEAGRQGGIFRVLRSLDDIEHSRDIEGRRSLIGSQAETELTKEIVKEVMQNPAKAERGLSVLSRLLGDSDSPIAKSAETTKEETQSEKPKSYEDKLANLAMRFQTESGAPPGAAFEAATQALRPDRVEIEQANKAIAQMRQQAEAAERVADLAEAGVSGAGQTGGVLYGPREIASRFWEIFSPEEREQRASQSLLDSVAPDIIKASREAGTGAMSDPEMREYLKAGPTSSKTPEQNRVLIEKIRNVARVGKEYADFVEAYTETNGTMTGAQAKWDEYKRANPLFVRSKGAELVFNNKRRSWREYFAGQGTTPTTPTAQGAATDMAQYLNRLSVGRPSPQSFASPQEYLAAVRAWETSGGQ